jgi:hypothetical protein
LAAAIALVLSAAAGRAETLPASRPAEPDRPPLRVVLFQSSTCSGCDKTEKALKDISQAWPTRVRTERRDLQKLEHFTALLTWEDHYGVGKNDQPPTVFVGTKYLSGIDNIAKNLRPLVADQLARGPEPSTPPTRPPAAPPAAPQTPTTPRPRKIPRRS